ncbi:MAG: acetylxylan esterase [Bacteroidales bacterium]|nr:acetylxylan esterase [Bacteroidales bacterium]
MKKNIFIFLRIIIFCSCGSIYGQGNLSNRDLTVLDEPADNMMQNYLTHIVDRQFSARDSLLSSLKTQSDWDQWASTIRDSMRSWTGPFPERTSLNARVTGRIEREDYVIEKILFESRPDYLVSANLYLPKDISFPRPAHLNVIGHAQVGKADERYQRMSIAQAKNGFVVLTIDQLGQGERQVSDYASWGGAPGNTHQIIGIKAFLSGTHVFNIMVWDAIRAVDYLVSRPEVDADKICMTGSSGGGMMTTYILPFDDRIQVSVPTCNPNTWSYRVHAGLATDHEQVFFGAFESSIDPRGDPLFAHVPKPLLLNTTTDDHLNPTRGVWDLSTWLYKTYSAHGVPEKFTTTMVRAGHAYNKEQREITYSWMLRWTDGDASDFWEGDAHLAAEEDLWAAENGSVFNESGNRQDQDLVLDYLSENKAQWKSITTQEDLNDRKKRMPDLVKNVLHVDLDHIQAKGDLKVSHEVGDVKVNSFVIEPEEGIVLPGVLLESGKNSMSDDIILYVSENGKSDVLREEKIVSEMLDEGYRICAVDLRGIGETAPDMVGKFWDFLAGKPIFGQRVRDVLTTVKWLKESDLNARHIKFWGKGMGSLYGAFAGVLTNDIDEFILEEPLISFESVVQVKVPEYNNEIMLPGILEKFDMPQVYQVLSPRPVSIINPRLGDKTSAGNSDINKMDDLILPAYKVTESEDAWSIKRVNEKKR